MKLQVKNCKQFKVKYILSIVKLDSQYKQQNIL